MGAFKGVITLGSFTCGATGGWDVLYWRLDANGLDAESPELMAIGGDGDQYGDRFVSAGGGVYSAAGHYSPKMTFPPTEPLTQTDGKGNGFVLQALTPANGSGTLCQLPVHDADYPTDVLVVDSDTTVLGSFTDTVTFDGLDGSPLTAEGIDIYLARFGGSGFCQRLGGKGHQVVQAAASLEGYPSDIVLVGKTDTGFEIGGDQLKAANGFDPFVARIGPSDEFGLSWAGGGDDDEAADVATTADGIAVVGSFTDSIDVQDTGHDAEGERSALVVMLDHLGVRKWSTSWGASNYARAERVALDGDHVVVTGTFLGNMELGPVTLEAPELADFFVAMLSARDGAVLWARSFGAAGPDEAPAVAVGEDGIYLAGTFTGGSIAFGDRTLTPVGGNDAYIVKLAP